MYLSPLGEDVRKDEDNNVLFILDWEGNEIERIALPLQVEMSDNDKVLASHYMCRAYAGATRDYVFATDSYYPNYYIEKSEIGSGKCEWKRIGYDGEMNETAQTD